MIEAANGPALAEDYPTKPVQLIEPFGTGGGPDLLARALAQQLSKLWGQPVTVENIPGGGSHGGARDGREVITRRLHAAREHERSGIQRRAFKRPPV